jgi:hypothetical protein
MPSETTCGWPGLYKDAAGETILGDYGFYSVGRLISCYPRSKQRHHQRARVSPFEEGKEDLHDTQISFSRRRRGYRPCRIVGQSMRW